MRSALTVGSTGTPSRVVGDLRQREDRAASTTRSTDLVFRDRLQNLWDEIKLTRCPCFTIFVPWMLENP